jgi:hypothetical protein
MVEESLSKVRGMANEADLAGRGRETQQSSGGGGEADSLAESRIRGGDGARLR